MSRTKLTPTTISENLNYLSSLSEADLNNQNVHELRQLLALCGVTQVTCLQERTLNRGNTPVVYSVGSEVRRADATRDECLQAVEEITRERKLLASATEFNGKVLVDQMPRRNWLTSALISGEYRGSEVAASLNTYILEDYPEPHQFQTRAVMRSKYIRKLKDNLVNRGYWDNVDVHERFGAFRSALCDLGKGENAIRRELYTERRKVRQARNRETTTYVTYNVTPLLNWAQQRLEKLPATSRQWREVALALSLVTGRRVTSEVINSNSHVSITPMLCAVLFDGFAKEREDRPKKPAIIPTLVEAGLVIGGFEWLASKGKTEADRDLAHRRYSSELGIKWREIAARFELPIFVDLPEKEAKELHKPHGCRKLYTNVVLMREGLTEDTAHPNLIDERAQEILAHEDLVTGAFYRMPLILTEDETNASE